MESCPLELHRNMFIQHNDERDPLKSLCFCPSTRGAASSAAQGDHPSVESCSYYYIADAFVGFLKLFNSLRFLSHSAVSCSIPSPLVPTRLDSVAQAPALVACPGCCLRNANGAKVCAPRREEVGEEEPSKNHCPIGVSSVYIVSEESQEELRKHKKNS